MKNPISSTSVQNRPAPVEPPTQNTGSLNGRTVNALLNSPVDRYGIIAFVIGSITGLALFVFHGLKCREQCPQNSFSFSVAGLTPNFCTLVGVSSMCVLIPTVIYPLIQRVQINRLLNEIRNELRRPLTEELKTEISSELKYARFLYARRFCIPCDEDTSLIIRSPDGTQAVVCMRTGEVSFHSSQDTSLAHSSTAPTKSLTQNTGWFTKRPIKVILNSAYNDYGENLAIICLFTGVMALTVALNACRKIDQKNDEMCPIPSNPSVACLASDYYSIISLIAVIAIACIPGIAQRLPD